MRKHTYLKMKAKRKQEREGERGRNRYRDKLFSFPNEPSINVQH